MSKIDTYSEFKKSVVEPDLKDFLAETDNLRKAWHCAGSLFHLSDWVYYAHKSSIDTRYKFRNDRGRDQPVSKTSEFANSLGQAHPQFQLIRGIANASKHFRLDPVPPGRNNPPGMPTYAANVYVSGSAFQPGAFQSNAFQTGDVKLEGPETEFAVLAQSVFDMWERLFASEGW